MEEELENSENSSSNLQEQSAFTFRVLDSEQESTKIPETQHKEEDTVNNESENKEEDEYEYVELDDELAIEHLAKVKGMTVDEFKDSLTPKEQKKYAPEIEGFQKFYEETGNKNFNDFLETQKDWNTENPEITLRESLRLKNPHLEKDELDFLYEEKYSIEELDEDDDAKEIKRRSINKKNDLIDAVKFFDERKEKFKGVGGSDEYIPIEYREAKKHYDSLPQQEEEFNKQLKEVREDNKYKANLVFDENFEGFKYDVTNEDKTIDKISYKPENISEAKNWHSDLKNLNDLFFDESGKITNAKEFFAVSEIARIGVQKYTEQIARTAQANLIERQDKISKNIQPDNIRNQVNGNGSGMTFRVIE